MSNKVYVDVLAEFSKDGLLIPKEITWEDGRKYEITRVKDKRRAASTRAGGVGERYTCVDLHTQARHAPIPHAIFSSKDR